MTLSTGRFLEDGFGAFEPVELNATPVSGLFDDETAPADADGPAETAPAENTD